jgi:glycosyltransferase involved in cell wall biosynthesis
MMPQRKYRIINILPDLPPYQAWGTKPPPEVHFTTPTSWIAMFGYDWPNIVGGYLLKYSDDFEFEFWQPDLRADKVYTHVWENGLVQKNFPAVQHRVLTGIKPTISHLSPAMNDELERLIREDNRIIVHLNARIHPVMQDITNRFIGRVPIIHQFYGHFYHIFRDQADSPFLSRMNWKIFLLKTRKFYSQISELFVSQLDQLEYLRKYCSANLYLTPWPIDYDAWTLDKTKAEARKLLGIPEDPFLFFQSCRLNDHKQILQYIDTLSKIKDLNFRAYFSGHGSAEYMAQVHAKIAALGMDDKVFFTGWLSEEDMKNYYIASDAFVSTSFSEGGPTSVVRALALEIPVISTDTGYSVSVMRHFDVGKVIPLADYAEWEKAFREAVEKRNLKANTRKALIEFLNYKDVISTYIQGYTTTYQKFYAK